MHCRSHLGQILGSHTVIGFQIGSAHVHQHGDLIIAVAHKRRVFLSRTAGNLIVYSC